MKRLSIIMALCAVVFAGGVQAQETYFGKNKVRYKDFDWKYIQTPHFDIYFYEEAYATAKFTATVMESSYVEVSGELNYLIQEPIPVFVYNSHNDFQQTNIISSIIPEGVGGFTEAFKNRIVIPFAGSYEEFRHVLHHELTHAVIYDMLYGNMFSSLISRQRLFNLPLWFAEGYAEYSSRHGWDYFSDMFVRDATINNYLAPPQYIGGYLAYKQGQAMVKYIADRYGEDKLGLILKKGKIHLTMNRALKEVIGVNEEEFYEDFAKEMKRRYWPEIANRKEADEIGKQLTHSRKDGSYFNEKPAFSPQGDKIAIFTDKSDYTEIVLISATTGERLERLVKSERSGDLESLHSFVSGMSYSPDGQNLVFVAKSDGKPTLMFYNLRRNKIYFKESFDEPRHINVIGQRSGFYNIVNPAWSPDGSMIAFSALKGNARDIFIYHLETEELDRVTNDRFDDTEPSWLPDSKGLVFSSDRLHPDTPERDSIGHLYVSTGAFLPGDFDYGFYNLFRTDLGSGEIEPLRAGPGQNRAPQVSPDGTQVAFISNRNGIDNIYIAYLDSTRYFAITDILTGVTSLTWSPDGDKIAYSAFAKGGFDIFVMKDLVPVGEEGVLAATDFVKGEYNLLKNGRSAKLASQDISDSPDSIGTDTIAHILGDEYVAYPVSDTGEFTRIMDSLDTDTSVVLANVPDSSEAGEHSGSETEEKDTLITESGIYDEEFVFISDDQSRDPFDSLFLDIPEDSAAWAGGITMEEAEIFESRPHPDVGGDYKIKDYRVKFTPDYVGGGLSYDTFFGLRGQSFFVFSDYLGNHQIFLATDLVNTIDQSNVQLFYFYNRHRTNYGAGMFHTKNFYLDERDYLFSDRFYGAQGYISRPFSTFSRVDLLVSQYFIDRQYYDFGDPREDRSSKVTTAELAYVTDNIVWGLTGPVNGRRARLAVSGGKNLFDSQDIEFSAVDFDYRRYWHFKSQFSLAFRVAGGMSFGNTPKLYFLGGTTNWIGNRTLDAKVYEVENLYFADVVTPLRGVPYYELSGNRYGLVNTEFRFPLIEYFAMRFPLPLVISRVTGAIFTDIGAAWTDDNFKGGTSEGGKNRLQDIKVGFGFGMRMNLGFLVLRYDVGWLTDMHSVSDKASHYFSFGADF